jgi:hypothetical protein
VHQYFATNPAKENPDYYSQPIKFLKNYNLLALQLGDLTFRKIIMVQVIFFIHALRHPLARAPITLSETDKKVLTEIEVFPKKFLSTCGDSGMKLL